MIKSILDMNESVQIRYLNFIEDMDKSGWIFIDKKGMWALQTIKGDKAPTFH